jgi:hypothetical protein
MNGKLNRRALMAGAAAAAGVIAMPHVARSAAPVSLRVSSSAPPDKFGAHYLWYKPFEDELARRVGDKIKLE